MRTFTYSEAKRQLARVLDAAEATGKVIIRSKDGRTFALTPEKVRCSPLDVPSIRTAVSTKELVAIVQGERIRSRGSSSRY